MREESTATRRPDSIGLAITAAVFGYFLTRLHPWFAIQGIEWVWYLGIGITGALWFGVLVCPGSEAGRVVRLRPPGKLLVLAGSLAFVATLLLMSEVPLPLGLATRSGAMMAFLVVAILSIAGVSRFQEVSTRQITAHPAGGFLLHLTGSEIEKLRPTIERELHGRMTGPGEWRVLPADARELARFAKRHGFDFVAHEPPSKEG